MPKPNGKHPKRTDTNQMPVPVTISFDEAVREGKDIQAKRQEAERSQLRLGQIADTVEPKYKDRTLAKLAEKIGIESNTLNHYRTVYRAWKGILPPAAKSTSFAVLQVLASHEDRVALITAEPNMSKRRAEVLCVLKDHANREEILSKHPNLSCTKTTRDYMRSYDEGAKETAQEDEWLKDNKRWFADAVELANEATKTADFIHQCTDEQRHRLLKVVEPAHLEYIRRGGKFLVELADYLQAALAEDVPEPKGRKRRAKEETTSAEAAMA